MRSPYQRRFGTPQQASALDSDRDAVLELDPKLIPEAALRDLAGVERLWVLSFLHRSGTWGPSVRPPRGARVRRGLSRRAHRIAPIRSGYRRFSSCASRAPSSTCAASICSTGTPILDLKPYIPYADAFPASRAGWIDEIPTEELQFAKRPPHESK